jgi:hypothetical protein
MPENIDTHGCQSRPTDTILFIRGTALTSVGIFLFFADQPGVGRKMKGAEKCRCRQSLPEWHST